MNREIKFKAKCKDNGEWVYGSYIQSYNNNDWIVQDGDFFSVDSDTVSQFTGFYDKDGKAIYEGDILHYVSTKVVYVVYYNIIRCSFNLVCLNNVDEIIFKNSWIDVLLYSKVLGNKFDNPELLKNDKP